MRSIKLNFSATLLTLDLKAKNFRKLKTLLSESFGGNYARALSLTAVWSPVVIVPQTTFFATSTPPPGYWYPFYALSPSKEPICRLYVDFYIFLKWKKCNLKDVLNIKMLNMNSLFFFSHMATDWTWSATLAETVFIEDKEVYWQHFNGSSAVLFNGKSRPGTSAVFDLYCMVSLPGLECK